MVSLTSRELKRGKGALLFLGLVWWGVDCNGVTTFRNFSKKRLSLPLVEDSAEDNCLICRKIVAKTFGRYSTDFFFIFLPFFVDCFFSIFFYFPTFTLLTNLLKKSI